MDIEITCFTCYESFTDYIDIQNGSYNEIIDCEICCRPNKISLTRKNDQIIEFDVSDGNE